MFKVDDFHCDSLNIQQFVIHFKLLSTRVLFIVVIIQIVVFVLYSVCNRYHVLWIIQMMSNHIEKKCQIDTVLQYPKCSRNFDDCLMGFLRAKNKSATNTAFM